METIYRMEFDYGRMGSLSGLFIAESDEIDTLITSEREINFGEILGKHSDVCCSLTRSDIDVISSDPADIEFFKRLNLQTGYNPLDFLSEEDYEEEDYEEEDYNDEDNDIEDEPSPEEQLLKILSDENYNSFHNRTKYENLLTKCTQAIEKYPMYVGFKLLIIDVECRRLDYATFEYLEMQKKPNVLKPSHWTPEWIAEREIEYKQQSEKRWAQSIIDKEKLLNEN